MMRISKRGWGIALVLGLGAVFLVLAMTVWSSVSFLVARPKSPNGARVTVSQATTRITQPLRSDGYVDYVKALNQMASKDVTPENNAVVLLWKAFDPRLITPSIRKEYFRLLGVPVPPAKGAYFVTIDDFVKRRQQLGSDAPLDKSSSANKNFLDKVDAAAERPWKKDTYAVIAQWLEANDQPLSVIVQASKRTRWHSPLVSLGRSTALLTVALTAAQQMRNAARALCTRAMLELGTGNHQQAWSDLMACHRLARLQSQGPMLIHRLVAIAIDSMACHGDWQLLRHTRPTGEQARNMLADLNQLAPLPSMTDVLDRGERFTGLDAISAMARDGPQTLSEMVDEETAESFENRFGGWTMSMIDWDLILRIFNGWYDRNVEAARKPTRTERKAAWSAIETDLNEVSKEARSWKSWLSAPFSMRKTVSKGIGYVFVSLFLPAVSAVGDAWDREEMETALTKLGFALAACRAEHGSYPEKLSALAPDYLAKIPIDVFIAEPLHYASDGDSYTLYSVGRNEKDDGGKNSWSGDEAGFEADDLVLRVPAGDGE